jgi:hypothetical protein
MFVEAVEAVSTGVSVYELSVKLQPWLKRVLNLLKNGELTIAIFGAGGTGKTTVGRFLSGESNTDNLFIPYRESVAIEEYQLKSDVIGSVVVAPGQKRREDTWDDLLRNISAGKIQLIINVVSWGYHSFSDFSYQQHPLFKAGMSSEEFVNVYAQDYRQRELDALRILVPHISISERPKTILITLVTKQDLWWSHRNQVENYYKNGEYETIIQEIRSRQGSANFTHEYQSASLVLENFVSGANELLVPTTAGYDQKLQFANFSAFLKMVESLLNISLGMK